MRRTFEIYLVAPSSPSITTQREYRWQTKQVAELIEDLFERFEDNYKEGQDREEVQNYGHYFLGSIIVSNKEGRKFIVDGQQRLTTLTLLLIHIRRLLKDDEQRAQLSDLNFLTESWQAVIQH